LQFVLIRIIFVHELLRKYIKLISMQSSEQEKNRWAKLYDHGDYSKIAREISPSTQSYQVKKVMDSGEGSHIYVSAITRFYNKREAVMAQLTSNEQEA